MTESLNKPMLVMVALSQGLLLFWLKEALAYEVWPHEVRAAEVLLWSLCICIPILLLLSLNTENTKRAFIGAGVFALVVAICAGYFGFQLEPNDKIMASDLIWIYGITLGVLSFKVVMYLQIWAGQQPLTYAQLFLYSWRNIILVALCLLFVLIFGGILALWAGLFSVVGIDLFKDIFSESWFLFPALALANGLAFVIFRNLVGILDTMSRVLRALCQFLLPVLIFISVLFLICLPFVGISALWDTGRGTALVLWLQALILFFFNATFQSEQESSPYWKPLQRFVSLGLLVLPIYSFIAIYGLWLRVDQYGLTVARCWAIVVVAMMALFAIAYSANLIWFKDKAADKFGWINVRMGLVVMALMVLVNTPLLDFRKATVNSQVAMLESGQTDLEDFDVSYFAWQLARPGLLALEELKIDADEGFVRRVDNAYRRNFNQETPLDPEGALERITFYPEDLEVPDLLIDKVVAQLTTNRGLTDAYILHPDLNEDGEGEWVVLTQTQWDYGTASLWRLEDSGWQDQAMAYSQFGTDDLRQAIRAGAVSVETPQWKQLKIGETIIRILE